MKKGINCNANQVYLTCKHCNGSYDLIDAKRNTSRRDPIRCPHCGCIVAK